MLDASTIVLIGATFLLAGTVKGVIGLGLPTISLALLTLALDLRQAIALILIPSAVTNLWQALAGGNLRAILQRFWPFLFIATATVGVGTLALTRVDEAWLSALLGLVLLAYSLTSLIGFRPHLSKARERWLGPLAGLANGVLTGMTGSFVVPGVLFLQATGLSHHVLVQAMGVLFTLSTLALAVGLEDADLLPARLVALSGAALMPALVGMVLGRRIREGLSEAAFRRVFFTALAVLGGFIVVTAVGRM